MHVRRFGTAGSIAAAVILAASACATGTGVDAYEYAGDAADDRGAAGDTSPFSQDSGPRADTGTAFYDSGPAYYDSGAVSYDSGPGADVYVGPADSSPGVDSASQDSGAGGGEAGPPPTGIGVLYAVQESAATSPYLGCEISVTNSGSTSVAVAGLEVRYYYSNEVHLTPQMTINWSHLSTSGADTDLTVTYTVDALQPATTEADTYIAFDLSSSHSMLAPGESAVFSWQMQGPNPAVDVYTQTNDYSFDASMTALTSWDHIPLFQSGNVAWGTPP